MRVHELAKELDITSKELIEMFMVLNIYYRGICKNLVKFSKTEQH